MSKAGLSSILGSISTFMFRLDVTSLFGNFGLTLLY
jgi:hypothetical protein